MARRDSNFRLGYLLLSLIIAAVLWGVAHGRGSTERPADIPVVFENIPEQLVITSRNVDAVNVRVRGSRAALANVDPDEYRVDVSNANAGPAVYEVDTFRIEEELPRGARLVSPLALQHRGDLRAARPQVRPGAPGSRGRAGAGLRDPDGRGPPAPGLAHRAPAATSYGSRRS